MLVEPAARLFATAVAMIAAPLLAAKAHGRQVRLEREAEGFFEVDFRGRNPPPVEAIWKADRGVYWRSFAMFAAGGLFTLVFQVPRVELYRVDGPWGVVWEWASRIAWLPFVLAFFFAGWASLLRMHVVRRRPRRGLAGTVAWWILSLVAFFAWAFLRVDSIAPAA